MKFIIVLAILFIIMVDVYDIYLTVELQEHLIDHERNPVAIYILQQDDENVSLLVTMKVIGLLAVAWSLDLLRRHKIKYRAWIVGVIFIFQGWLLYYLMM